MAASPSPLGPQWRIDNFYRRGASLLPKKGFGYEGEIWVDADGDGVVDDLGERPHFDLRFTHARSSAVIWLRSLPLESAMRSKAQRVLMRDFVAAMSAPAPASTPAR